jgi:CheY-like chemotaxis protein
MRTVLLVERDDARDLYAAYLPTEGFRVVVADSIEEARTLAATADVLVTAMNVRRRRDGLDLVEALRTDTRTSTLPIVVLSASARAEDARRAVDAGCDVFLPKPCLPVELAVEIRHALIGRARRRPYPTRGGRARS